jgi:ADP-ribose pyrophosphatase YjhB (NUDIX family)
VAVPAVRVDLLRQSGARDGGHRARPARRPALPPRRGTVRGTWDLAGGFLEVGERPERGLRRELREELGARVRSARLVGFEIDRYGPGGAAVLGLVFEVRLVGRVRARSDVSEVRWFPRNAIPWRQIGFASIRRALRANLRSR